MDSSRPTPETVPLDVEAVRALRSIDRRLAGLGRDLETIKWLIILWWALAAFGALGWIVVLAG